LDNIKYGLLWKFACDSTRKQFEDSRAFFETRFLALTNGFFAFPFGLGILGFATFA